MKVSKYDSAILEWVDMNQIKNSRNEPFEFDLHSFLIDPLCDWNREIVIRKSAQVGFSESFGGLKALFAAKHLKLDVIYTLPTNSAAEDFVRQKVNPIIEKNPIINKDVKQDLLDMKQVEDRFIRFRGTHNTETSDKKEGSAQAITITSDLNIYDERDRSDQFVIDQYSSRLENSLFAGEWSFSNPSYPGVGTDGLWEDSDMKHWMIKCDKCNHFQYLDWVKEGEVSGTQDHCLVSVERGVYACSKCGAEITPTQIIRGEWVAKHPDHERSGYWMSQMNYVRHTVPSLLRKEADRTPSTFNNFVIGKPYRDSTQSVDRGIIVDNIVRGNSDKKNVYMGVDQGIKKHYVIGDDNGLFEVGVTEDWNKIDELIRKYNATTVIDNGPDRRTPEKLAAKYDGKNGRPKVYRCVYKESRDPREVIEFGKGKKSGYVWVERTMAFDSLVDYMVNKLYPINIGIQHLDVYIDHWKTLNRIEVTDTKGIIRPKWETSTGEDHYCHATLYQWVASSKARGTGSIASFNKSTFQSQPAIIVDDEWQSTLPTFNEITKPRNPWNR